MIHHNSDSTPKGSVEFNPSELVSQFRNQSFFSAAAGTVAILLPSSPT
jgi:hypothetical protein